MSIDPVPPSDEEEAALIAVSAQQTIDEYGEDALAILLDREARSIEDGDDVSAGVWRDIARAVVKISEVTDLRAGEAHRRRPTPARYRGCD